MNDDEAADLLRRRTKATILMRESFSRDSKYPAGVKFVGIFQVPGNIILRMPDAPEDVERRMTGVGAVDRFGNVYYHFIETQKGQAEAVINVWVRTSPTRVENASPAPPPPDRIRVGMRVHAPEDGVWNYEHGNSVTEGDWPAYVKAVNSDAHGRRCVLRHPQSGLTSFCDPNDERLQIYIDEEK